ncbi:MAG: cell division protein FtsL [Methylococcales bacterium]|nr:cell division protein FtsL [Methylococcales bacterium]
MTVARFFIWFLFVSFLMASALGVVYSKYQSRLLFFEIQQQQSYLEKQAIEWGQLQLEITTLTSENRVEIEAIENLGLVFPYRKRIIYLKQDEK